MKKSVLIVAVLFMFGVIGVGQVKTEKQIKNDLKDKAIKEARKEAKRLKKDDWKVMPGSLPLEKLVENAWIKQMQTTEEGQQRYLVADGNGLAESQSVAEMQAIETGKLQLAGLIETQVASLVTANLGNSQLSTQDAASVTEVVQSSKNIIAQELGFVSPEFKIYREKKKTKTVECQVRLFYDSLQAMSIAKKTVREEIKDKLKVNEEQLNKLMGMPQ